MYLGNILEINIKDNYEVGDCYTTSLKEIYEFFGIELTVEEILGIINNFNFDFNERKGKGSLECKIEFTRINNLFLLHRYYCFLNVESGMNFIRNELNNNRPILMSVNTFYLYYTNDYKKKSGGLFGGGHWIIVHGYDDDREEFIVSDCSFKKKYIKISYNELHNAWTYIGDAPYFKPMVLEAFSPVNKLGVYSEIITESLLHVLKTYLNDSKVCSRASIRSLIDELKKCHQGVYSNEEKRKIISNIANSIIHEVRWSRRAFGKFLLSKNLCSLGRNMEYESKVLRDNYQKWTGVFNYIFLYLNNGQNDNDRLESAINMMEKINNKEYKLINNLYENIMLNNECIAYMGEDL